MFSNFDLNLSPCECVDPRSYRKRTQPNSECMLYDTGFTPGSAVVISVRNLRVVTS